MLANPGRLKLQAIVLAALLAETPTPLAAQAQGTKIKSPSERAQQMLESEVTMITKLMHPTATYQSSEYSVTPLTGDKFQIVSKYYFKNLIGQEFYSALHFNFTARGSIAEIQLGERNGYVAPFLAADVGSNILEIVRNNKEVTTLLRRGQVRTGLILWLNGSF